MYAQSSPQTKVKNTVLKLAIVFRLNILFITYYQLFPQYDYYSLEQETTSLLANLIDLKIRYDDH